MKYNKFVYLCMCTALLAGCDNQLLGVVETIPVEESGAIIVNTIEAGYEPVADDKNDDDQKIIISSVDFSTVGETFGVLGLNLSDLHLNGTDENFIFEVAYHTGDTSLLGDNDKKIYDVVKEILDPLDEASDYDIVIAVHNRLAEMVNFDYSGNQYNAYGALVEKTAVCQGYAAAFKLCMDMADIPCLTVGGTATTDGEEVNHAWNMVKVNGQWYHVDVTWDDPNTNQEMGSWKHLYLYAGDDFMKLNHSWDTIVQGLHGVNSIPEAKDDYGMYLMNGNWVNSQEKLQEKFNDEYGQGKLAFEFVCDGFAPDIEFVAGYSSCSYIEEEVGNKTHIFIRLV